MSPDEKTPGSSEDSSLSANTGSQVDTGFDSNELSPGTVHYPVDCTKAFAELFAFLDQALEASHRRRIQGHLDGCPPCNHAYEFHFELKIVVQKTCRIELPEGLRDRIFHPILAETDAPPKG